MENFSEDVGRSTKPGIWAVMKDLQATERHNLTARGCFDRSRGVRIAILFSCVLLATNSIHRRGSAGTVPNFCFAQVRGGTFQFRTEVPGPVLVSFLRMVPETADSQSHTQAVYLMSMAHQYGMQSVRVAVIDSSFRGARLPLRHDMLVNASYDWQMSIPVLEDPANQAARWFGIGVVPTTLLIAPGGSVSERWEGVVRPATLAQGIEKLLPAMQHFRGEQGGF
jgi:hypothetical protein